MPATATELIGSRTTATGTSGSHERKYDVVGTNDEVTAIGAVSSTAPATYGGTGGVPYMRLTSIRVAPVFIDTSGDESKCRWEATASYSVPSSGGGGGGSGDAGDAAFFSFDTGGGTKHLQFSKDTPQFSPLGATDYDHAIEVENSNGSRSIKGVDVVAPAFQWRETVFLTDATVDDAYKVTLMNLTGAINDGAFRSFAEQEVLFLGAAGSRRADGVWELTYTFAARKNNDTWDDLGLGAMEVKGWDYVWAEYEDDPDDTDGNGDPIVSLKPKAVYAERVYDTADFSTIVFDET